jgi:hypothetical protein
MKISSRRWSRKFGFTSSVDLFKLFVALANRGERSVCICPTEGQDKRGFSMGVDSIKSLPFVNGCSSVSCFQFEGNDDRGRRVRVKKDFLISGWSSFQVREKV